MIYIWRCTQCGERVEVERQLVDYKLAPYGNETAHDGCDGTEFTRVVTYPKRIYVPETFNLKTFRE